jgi:hypothetical protein
MSGLKDSDYEFSAERARALEFAQRVESLEGELQGVEQHMQQVLAGLAAGLKASFSKVIAECQRWLAQTASANAQEASQSRADKLARSVTDGRKALAALTSAVYERAPLLERQLAERLAQWEATLAGRLTLLAQWLDDRQMTSLPAIAGEMQGQLERQELSALEKRLASEEQRLAKLVAQAQEQEAKHQKRLALLAALREVCRDLGFIEVRGPDYADAKDRGSRILFSVDTVNRGLIEFALTLDSIQSESAIADNHCYDEFDQLSRDLAEKFSIRTHFRPAGDAPPLQTRRGAKQLPGDTGLARGAGA